MVDAGYAAVVGLVVVTLVARTGEP
jgi:hypothetical protein